MPTPTPSTAKMSTQAAASVQKPALQKANPAEPGPTPKRPGAALSGADPASAVGGEAQATKAAVILPKPRVAPVQQPAVKHEEAVSAHTKRTVKREEAVPVQKPTVKKASPTPAVHRSGSGANLSRALYIGMTSLRTRFPGNTFVAGSYQANSLAPLPSRYGQRCVCRGRCGRLPPGNDRGYPCCSGGARQQRWRPCMQRPWGACFRGPCCGAGWHADGQAQSEGICRRGQLRRRTDWSSQWGGWE